MPEPFSFSFAASLQYRADRVPSSCHDRPLSSSAPSRPREIRKRLTAEGSFRLSAVREYCHHKPSIRVTRPALSIAARSSWLMALISVGVVASPYRMQVRPRRSLGSLVPLAWRMKVRRIPRTPPKRPARSEEHTSELQSLRHLVC